MSIITSSRDTLRGRHPLIVGLIRALPSEGADFPEERRQDWLKAAGLIFDMLWGKVDSPTRRGVQDDPSKSHASVTSA